MPVIVDRLPNVSSSHIEPSLIAQLGFSGSDAWLSIVHQTHQFNTYRLLSDEGSNQGCITLAHIHHPLFGNYLTSSPYGSFGGVVFSTEPERLALLNSVEELMKSCGASYAVLRFKDCGITPPTGWISHPIYRTYCVDLTPNEDTLLSSYSSNHRNHIRKAVKKGLSITFGQQEILDDAYEGMALGMHELGSPFHHKSYFTNIALAFGSNAHFVAVYAPDGTVAGGGLFIVQGAQATNLYANVIRDYRHLHSGEFLYWSAITHFQSIGIQSLDLGRSLIGSANENYKMKWNPVVHDLAYWFHLRGLKSVPQVNQKNTRLQAAVWLWQRMPRWFVRSVGPYLIRGVA